MQLHNPLAQRRSGVLLHPTSLPGPWCAGDFSHNAYRFIEFLAAAGQSVWQVLPLGPTHADGSPYQCLSTHAGNPLLVSLDWLVDRGWLETEIWQQARPTAEWRLATLHRGCERALESCDYHTRADFERFCRGQAFWLEDYANYIVLKQVHHGATWMDWPLPLRLCEADVVRSALMGFESELLIRKFEQYLFFTQWRSVRQYAHQHGIYVFGDLPIFVAGDSADVWAHRDCFAIDENGAGQVVAGVPPDAFSDEGQRWGNPIYNWPALERSGFSWWLDRLRTHFSLYDIVRIDHFRGFESYWEIPTESETAVNGQWVKAPGKSLLQAIENTFSDMPLVAEDLGIITNAVHELRSEFAIPGMKVLQFAFDGDPDNHHLPHNHSQDMVVYTGTHDNDTSLSWFHNADDHTRHRVRSYLQTDDSQMPWALMRCAMMSVANTAVLPMQDVLGLGGGHRLNTPGTVAGNWSWRFDWSLVAPQLAGQLRNLTALYGRDCGGKPVVSLQSENNWPLVERRKA